MPRRVDDVECQPLHIYPVTLTDPHGNNIHPTLFSHHGDTSGVIAQGAKSRDVICMDMGIRGLR